MQMKASRTLQRFMALILCLAMLLPNGLIPVGAAGADEPLAVVWAGSDYQGENYLDDILPVVKASYGTVDEAFFLGDYTYNHNDSAASSSGSAVVYNLLNSTWGLEDNDILFVQGNHDPAVYDHADVTGGYTREDYSVYLINEDDFPQNQGADVVEGTAAALDSYLDALVEDGYSKPVFVITHLPLHYGRGDNRYAGYLVDVLNEAGNAGLNIIYMFAHNHSNSEIPYDAYLGGSCIYLPKGAALPIHVAGSEEITTKTISFTYLNPGYVADVNTYNEAGYTQSSSVFEIYEDRVEIRRYSPSGTANLKNAGDISNYPENDNVMNSARRANVNRTVYSSPQSVALHMFDFSLTLGDLSDGTMFMGDSAEVTMHIADASAYDVSWSSSNEAVATVTGNGATATVTGVSAGTATITVTVGDAVARAVVATDTFDVTVVDPTIDVQSETVTLLTAGDTIYVRQSADWDDPLMLKKMEEDGIVVSEDTLFVLADESKNYADGAGARLVMTYVGGYDYSGDSVYAHSFFDDTNALYIKDVDIVNNNLWYLVEQNADDESTDYFLIRNKGDNQHVFIDDEYGDSNTYVRAKRSAPEASVDGGGWWKMTTSSGLSANKTKDGENNAYVLYYDESLEWFNATTGTVNSRLYLYYPSTATSAITAYATGKMSTVAAAYSDAENPYSTTGDQIVILKDGEQVEKIDITTDMLYQDDAVANLSAAGTYTVDVMYQGDLIVEDYKLTVENASEPPVTVPEPDDGGDTDPEEPTDPTDPTEPDDGGDTDNGTAENPKGTVVFTAEGGEDSALYKLIPITNGNALQDNKKYIIVTSNTAGEAVALGVTSDTAITGYAVDVLGLGTDMYVNANDALVWNSTETNEGEQAYDLWFHLTNEENGKTLAWDTQTNALYMGDENIIPFRWGSDYSNVGLRGYADMVDGDELERQRKYLNYQDNVFTLSNSNSEDRVFIYEQTTDAITISAEVNDASGTVASGSAGSTSTGDKVLVYTYGSDGSASVTEVDLTVDMLVDADGNALNISSAGTYSAQVKYMGTVIATNYTLEVTEATVTPDPDPDPNPDPDPDPEEPTIPDDLIEIEGVILMGNDGYGSNSSFFKLAENGLEEGKKYMIVTRDTAGEGVALGIGESATVGGYAVDVMELGNGDTANFYIDASDYNGENHIDDETLVWITQSAQGASGDAWYSFVSAETNEAITWNTDALFAGSDNVVAFRWGNTNYHSVGLRSWADATQQYLNYVDGKFTLSGSDEDTRIYVYEQDTTLRAVAAKVTDTTGTIPVDFYRNAETGDSVVVSVYNWDNSVTELSRVPITIDMLNITDEQLATPGTHTGLTVTYNGVVVCDNYTLVIENPAVNNYPDFPDEGAVRIGKDLNSTQYNYLETGAARIDLSVTGIPQRDGADVVFILDASSSMNDCIHNKAGDTNRTECDQKVDANGDGLCDSRLEVLKFSFTDLLELLRTDANGDPADVDIAVAQFNGYTPVVKEGQNSFPALNGEGNNTGPDESKVIQEFANIQTVNIEDVVSEIDPGSGTNYDRGMELAYQLLSAKQEQNNAAGLNRKSYVIFMSDGAPFQYNYIHGTASSAWNDYLNGDLPFDAGNFNNLAANIWAEYYNTKGEHWLAEAIKGETNQKYKIIDRNLANGTATGVTQIYGLGAEVFSIGLGLFQDGAVTPATNKAVLKAIASRDDYFYDVKEASDLEDAFNAFAFVVRTADDAVFQDQMGSNFDLLVETQKTVTVKNEDGTTSNKTVTYTPAPSIVLSSYDLYTWTEYEDGQIEKSQVGKRNEANPPEELEKVTFNAAGTEAYSDHVDVNGDGVVDTNDNILKDLPTNVADTTAKVICAEHFWYNMDHVNSALIIDTDSDGVYDEADGDILLAPETFYWDIGTIPEEELVLSYDVYLTGSMEGTRSAGTYDTNNYANLTYTNYLGNDCELSVPTPKLPWDQATVGYAFYLVNSDGDPIINQSTGETGSFENAVKLTQPVYENFQLNSGAENIIADIVADGVLPDGYGLFDEEAQYQVQLNSDGTGYYIIYTDDSGKQTTYVVGVSTTPVTGGNDDGEQIHTTDYATSNTVVWFGVVANVSCVPDTVVIDYGLPVDINVLANDTMMGNYGALKYIGSAANTAFTPAENQKLWQYLQGYAVSQTPVFTTTELLGEVGVAKINGTEVRYTLNDASAEVNNGMQMETEETFVYAVDYTGTVGTQGYYYSTVTVIPATTIYYEDSFLTYTVYDYDTEKPIVAADAQWQIVTDENYSEDATQAEDRPGEFSLSGLDANNIYGSDGAYKTMGKYSLGSSRMVRIGEYSVEKDGSTANYNTYATAEFTFSGTGFDVVSVTSDKTGTIVVQVAGVSNGVSENYVVDTYYGYKWAQYDSTGDGVIDGNDEYGWVVDDNAADALYQIPVMKVEDLPYGQYNVTITASHAELFDHAQYDGKYYDFYLDAIRIYDPANDGEGNQVIQDAYVADEEGWPEYFELRDLLISKADFNSTTVPMDGIVFIDGNKVLGSGTGTGVDGEVTDNLKPEALAAAAIEDYANYGPNNELYLAPGQAVAFDLAVPDNVAAIHLALKSVGGTAKAKVYNAEVNQSEIRLSDVATATDLYYDITQLNNKTVVIYNAGTSDDAILSVTNIKVTYTSQHTDGLEDSFFKVSNESAGAAVASLLMIYDIEEPEEEVPETTPPETTTPTEPEEPETFEPEKFNVKLSDSRVKVGSKVVVTVTTSDDVEYITINGVKVTSYSTSRRSDDRTWKVKVTADTVGEMDINVFCCSDEGQASETITKTVTVSPKSNSVVGQLLDVLVGLLSGLFGRN